MVNFTFHVPTKIFFGKGQIAELGKNITEYGKRILLCYGKGSIKKTGVYDAVVNELKKAHVHFEELGGIDPNPRFEDVQKGIALAREQGLDCILAVGGGSTIDCAKGIAAGFYHEGSPWDFVTGEAVVTKALPLATVLTIAATGSEMNGGSVISRMDINEKRSFISRHTLPKFSILDPEYTYTLPKNQTAAGVTDIMSHTMENYFTLGDGAYLQDRFAEAILKTCITYGPVAMNDPENETARANILWAGSWAINGLLNAGKATGWSVHAMEHELSAFYDITHGAGLAILTPYWLSYVCNETTVDKIAEFAVNVWGCDPSKERFALAQEGIDKLRSFFSSLGLPERLSDVGINEEKLGLMAKRAVTHKRGEIRGFQTLTEDDVKKIYELAR